MSGRWHDVLDEIEARIDLAERGEQVEFVPPEGLGQIPAELVPRAQALVTRGAQVEAGLTERAEELRAQLRKIPRRHTERGTTNRLDIQA